MSVRTQALPCSVGCELYEIFLFNQTDRIVAKQQPQWRITYGCEIQNDFGRFDRISGLAARALLDGGMCRIAFHLNQMLIGIL